jgi:hypothetical protein
MALDAPGRPTTAFRHIAHRIEFYLLCPWLLT